MLCTIQIRISSPVIGNRWSAKRRCYEFPREKGEDGWTLSVRDRDLLNGCVKNAIGSLGMDLDADLFRWPKVIPLPRVYLHEVPKRNGGFTAHEAISRNTIVTFWLMLRRHEGNKQLRLPSAEQLHEIFKFIGDYEGISPFGSERGFGLFSVVNIDLDRRSVCGNQEPPGFTPKDPDVPNEVDAVDPGEA